MNSKSKASVLDTKETFLHFSPKVRGSDEQKNDFFRSLYRVLNLRIADALESTSIANDEDVNKVIRRLRFCSSLSLVEVDDTLAGVKSVSKKCRSKFCYICNRQKSKKLSHRLIKLLTTELRPFRHYRFYFLTLTLKHDNKTRNYDYLSELKDYQNKLFRSKKFKKLFGDEIGIIQAFENSLVKGYHIHSHNLIMAPRLTTAAKKAEAQIRSIWKRLTKDSTQVRLDLVCKGLGDDDTKLMGTIMELFKYSTKMSFKSDNSADRNEKLAQWVISSKHKNFLNAKGLFRGHELTSYKSKLDDIFDKPGYDLLKDYYFVRTASLKFNHSTRKEYTADERREILKEIYLKRINSTLNVTGLEEEFENLLLLGFNDADLKEILTKEKQAIDSVRSVEGFEFDQTSTASQRTLFDTSINAVMQ